MVSNLVRAGVLFVLCLYIVSGHVGIAVVLLTMFALGTAEVCSDSTSATLIPMLVAKPDLGVANSRLQDGCLVGNQLIGPPMGRDEVGLATPIDPHARVGHLHFQPHLGCCLVGAGALVLSSGGDGGGRKRWGLAAPFWFAFFGSALTLALVRRQLGLIAVADQESMEAHGEHHADDIEPEVV